MSILDIYARASKRLPLTPGERALLRTGDQLLLSAIGGAIIAVLQAWLSGGHVITFRGLAQVAAYALATALLTGLAKLLRAQGDTTTGDSVSQLLATALDGVAGQLEQRAPVLPPVPPRAGTVGATAARYTGATSRPLSAGLNAGQGSGSFPPSFPPGTLDTPRRRADLLAQAGGVSISSSQPGAHTQPTASVRPPVNLSPNLVASAATSTPRQPTSAQTAPLSAAAPAPSQRDTAFGDDPSGHAEEGDGPPTQELPAVQAKREDSFLR